MAVRFPISRILRCSCGALLLAGVLLGGVHADWDFLADQRARRSALYGPLGEGQQRIDAWQRHVGHVRSKSASWNSSRSINLLLQQTTDVTSKTLTCGTQVDYWETPVEALWKGAGDCEDYAIAKYFSLRHLGVSSDKLRITYVKALESESRAHGADLLLKPGSRTRWCSTALIDSIMPASQTKGFAAGLRFQRRRACGYRGPRAIRRSGTPNVCPVGRMC